MKTWLGLALTVVLVGVGSAAPGHAATPTPATPAPAEVSSVVPAPPPTLVADTAIDSRLHDLVFTTPALPGQVHVRVLMPAGYDASADTRYPVLLLLDGCCNSTPQAGDWTTMGDAEAITAKAPVIVVMPDCGEAGWYTDWPAGAGGLTGSPAWETFHIGQLLPWIDAHYRTVPGRSGHAVAGLSMGGFGAMSYAARHPDLFISASSFSGAVNSLDTGAGSTLVSGSPVLDEEPPDGAFGPEATNKINWRAHNPVDLAANLTGLNLTLRTGNGMPGSDPAAIGGVNRPDAIEVTVHQETLQLDSTLTADGLPRLLDDYGAGSHSWEFWQRDLTETLPTIMATFAHPPAVPDGFSYLAVAPDFGVYGYTVALDRPVLEEAQLQHVTADGFALAGSGQAAVTTAGRYAAGRYYSLRETDVAGGRTVVEQASAAGRLVARLDLGPSSTVQQDAPTDLGTRPRSAATVAITELPETAMPTTKVTAAHGQHAVPKSITGRAKRATGRPSVAAAQHTLAYTGLDRTLAVIALLLMAGALLARRRARA